MEAGRARAAGYSALHVTTEMTWILGELRSREKLLEYEARLNEFVSRGWCMCLCQCSPQRLAPDVLLDVARVRLLIAVGTMVCDNSYPRADG
jgi:hypothetical protein